MDALGKSPIPIPMLILGKLSMLLCWLFFLVKTTSINTMLYDSSVTRISAILLIAAGIIILIFAFIHLGRSVSVGLPEEKTELKTEGIYRFSRNPMYLSGFLICIGSCLFSMYVVNFILCAVAISIHHWVVTKEEKFLEKRFGTQWLDYKNQVPRYFGRIKKASIPGIQNSF